MNDRQLLTNFSENAESNYREIMKLVDFFHSIQPGIEFTDMKKNLTLAYNVIGAKSIIEYTSQFILMFEDDILNTRIEKIYNYNYESLIKDDTIDETFNLIRSLINSIRGIWKKSDPKRKILIKISIFKLLKYSLKYKELNPLII